MIEFRKIAQNLELWEIFYTECIDHIKALDEIYSKLPQEPTQKLNDDNLVRKLSTRLHRLKGSLGFLGFKELSEDVKTIEDSLKTSSTVTPHQITKLCEELKTIIQELGLLIGKKDNA